MVYGHSVIIYGYSVDRPINFTKQKPSLENIYTKMSSPPQNTISTTFIHV